MVMIRLYFKTY